MNVVGIGTDIVECLRIAQMIERHGEVFLRRIYTQAEIEYCSSRSLASQHYAARWAGKMAVLRAMNVAYRGAADWRDIEIRTTSNSQLSVALAGELRHKCATRRIERVAVTLAHCRTHATAYAIAFDQEE